MEGEAFNEAAPGIEEGKEVAPGFDQLPLAFPIEPLQEKPKKSVLQQIRGGFFTAIGAVKNAGIRAKEKIEEAKVGEKIVGAASTAGHFIVDKTKLAATAVKNQGSKIAVSLLRTVAKRSREERRRQNQRRTFHCWRRRVRSKSKSTRRHSQLPGRRLLERVQTQGKR